MAVSGVNANRLPIVDCETEGEDSFSVDEFSIARGVALYHDPDWPVQARAMGGESGVTAVVNAVPDGSAPAIGTVRDGGRLTTITLDPPEEQRGIEISSVIVEPDGRALGELAELAATGRLDVSIAATYTLDEAAEALAAAVGGGGGAVALRP